MLQRTVAVKKRGLGLFLVVGLAVAMALLTWFSVQAEGTPASNALEQDDHETQGSTPVTVQGTEAVSTTVHLPFVAKKEPMLHSIVGLQIHRITPEGGLAEAVNAGVTWVRFDTFRWNEIEPVRTDPPTYSWGRVRASNLINAQQNGMEVVAIVRGAANWALKTPGPICGPIDEGALKAFGEFMNALVARYSQPPYNVHYWEIGNEPDIDPDVVPDLNSEYGCWGDWDDPYYGGRYYAEMLKVVYPAIKAADPQAQVILGGLLLGCDPRHPDGCTGRPNADRPSRFLEGILLNGGGDYFDIMGYHSYSYWDFQSGLGFMGTPRWPGSDTVVPEKADFVREVLAQYGHGDKPVMNTEAALLCYDGQLPLGCREQQAVFIPRAFADAMAEGLESMIYYAITNDHWLNTGLLRKEDRSPYQTYYSYVATSDYLSSAEYVGPAHGYPPGIEGHEFASPTGRLDLVWSADSAPRSVVLAAGVSAYDHYGTLVGTGTTIRVDWHPVWVTKP